MTDASAATVLGLPPVPPPQLDPYLDAAFRCFARHGLHRTRVTDIADEVGVSRVTVYRQLGTVEHAARLLLARELDRLVTSVLPQLAGARDAEDLFAVIASAVDYAVSHPVLAKVLADEGDLAGAFVLNEFETLLDRLLLLADPVVARLEEFAGSSGIDVGLLSEWVARVVMTLVIAPSTRPTADFIGAVLRPLLGGPSSPSR